MNRPFTPIKLRNDNGPHKIAGVAAAQADAHAQDTHETLPFAPLRQNNQVECFTTGEKYYTALRTVLKGAKKSIFIAGWQVNWDLELAPVAHPGERLIDILADRIQSSPTFRVFVMPWMSPKVGLNTGDLETMLAVFQLNAGRETMQAMCCPAGGQSDYVGTEGAGFSHHQKMIVVDNEYAYIGGMDLAYGRFDDSSFSLNPGIHRRFNERYNPGVPGSRNVTPQDGACLSTMDLLMTTLTAGTWNIGGNSEPGAVSQFIHGALGDAEKWAVKAVQAVNDGQRFQKNVASAMLKGGADLAVAGAKAGGHAVIAAADARLDVAVAAANAVSRTANSLRIPDLHGALIDVKVDSAPTSNIPNALRTGETAVRKGWNTSVEDLSSVASFLAPLNRLRVRPTPHSSLPGMAEGIERREREAYNATIDSAAAMAEFGQHAAEQGRQVCVEIGPAVQSGVDQAKAARREAIAQVEAGVHRAKRAVASGLNQFQQAIIGEINGVREALHNDVMALVARGDNAADNALANLSQAKVQAAIGRVLRLAKLIYAAQLAINWKHAATHPLLLKKGTKSSPNGGVMLGETQPREPWQDVHVQIKGPSVDDVARNFIRRWNAAQASYLSDQTLGDAAGLIGAVFGGAVGRLPGGPGAVVGARLGGMAGEKTSGKVVPHLGKEVRQALLIPSDLVPVPRPPVIAPPAGVAVRVLRSAPYKLCKQEAQAGKDKVMPTHEQHEIQTQMINLIMGATDFVYIENQFFQTEFGQASIDVTTERGKKLISGPMKYLMSIRSNRIMAELSSAGSAEGKFTLPMNGIGKALGDRIAMAVRYGQPFHVYLVLPVHPEGSLADIMVVGQVHWTMQSLVFADRSLVNLVRRAIAAKKLCKQPHNQQAWEAALVEASLGGDNAPYKRVFEADWSKYLTLLNLRNCEKVDGVVRTEQIYVHNKLMIVDDRHVIVGSANINDRSQSGKRDSEIAVMLMDSAVERKTIRDAKTNVNTLARKLRVDVWKKHFALAGGNDIVKPATEMAELIERPAAMETIKKIQGMARSNAKIYSDTFPHVPWSIAASEGMPDSGASLWPVCRKDMSTKDVEELSRRMPFHQDFWRLPNRPPEVPVGIKGFFTKLPTNWTIGENNHPENMDVLLLTMQSNREGHGSTPEDSDPNQNQTVV